MLSLALTLASAVLVSPQVQAQALYTVRVADPTTARVTVELELSNAPPELDAVEFEMAEGFAFTRFHEARVLEPWRTTVAGESGELSRSAPFLWRVPTAGASTLEVAYDVPLDHRALPEVGSRGDYEMPFLAADHGMLTCGAVFALPRLADVALRVRFELPAGWPALCPWPEVAPGVFAPGRAADLQDGLVALGAWTVHDLDAGGARAVVAFAPSEAYLAADAAPLVQALVAREIEVFGGAPLQRYLFLFTPSTVQGFAGSAKQGAMVLAVGKNLPANVVRPYVTHLVAHEFFHTWASTRYECPDELRFFSEGFTDFYAYATAAEIGELSATELERTIGDKLVAYERAAERTGLSLAHAGGPEFFAGGAAYEQVYAGGLVLAALCRRALEQHASADPAPTLDDFMRALNNDARWTPGEAAPRLGDFEATLARFAGADFASWARELVETPRADLGAALVDLGCKVERTSSPAALELRANLDGTTLRDLDPDCAAGLIGLRAGDELLAVNGVAVAKPAECYRAFQTPVDGRLKVELRRAGVEQTIDAPVPERAQIVFGWRR
jgi:predicted metalloprotease with PDZ domain